MTYKSAHARRGFTILEALIALALVSSGLTAIGAVVATSTRGVHSLERHLALINTARAILGAVPPDDRLVASDSSGERDGVRWSVEIEPVSTALIENSPWIPEVVRVRVRHPSGASFSLETIRLQRKPAS